MPIRQFVHVINADSVEHTINDRRFSGGKLTLQPGEEYDLGNDIWMDHRRRHQSWLKDTYVLEQQAKAAELAEAQAVETAEVETQTEEPAEATETVTPVETAEEANSEGEDPEVKSTVKMADIRALAKELNITIPVGTTKDEAYALVMAAAETNANAGEQPEEGNDDEN
jgi:hypothetical protein